jgi:hypothetical protein
MEFPAFPHVPARGVRGTWWSIPLLLAVCSAARADDGYVGSAGGNLFQEKAHSIQMVRERVHVQLRQGVCHVTCRFWLFNSSQQPQRVIVGFPDYEDNPASTTKPLRKFTCSVNGTPERDIARTIQRTVFPPDRTVLQSGRVVSDTLEWDRWWFTWMVDFGPRDTTVIDNEYDGLWGGTPCEREFVYVLGTGATWSGPILDGRITFDHTALASTQFVLREAIQGALQLRPRFYDDSTVYVFTNYLPAPDEVVHIAFHAYWDHDAQCPGEYGAPITSAEQAAIMRNEVYARHGYIFKDPGLADRFRRAAWYKPNPRFRTEMLPPKEAAWVANLMAIERKLRLGGRQGGHR